MSSGKSTVKLQPVSMILTYTLCLFRRNFWASGIVDVYYKAVDTDFDTTSRTVEYPNDAFLDLYEKQ